VDPTLNYMNPVNNTRAYLKVFGLTHNEINNNNNNNNDNNNNKNKHSLSGNTKGYGGKLTKLIHIIAIKLHLVAESCAICNSHSRQQIRKLLDTQSYYTPFL